MAYRNNDIFKKRIKNNPLNFTANNFFQKGKKSLSKEDSFNDYNKFNDFSSSTRNLKIRKFFMQPYSAKINK